MSQCIIISSLPVEITNADRKFCRPLVNLSEQAMEPFELRFLSVAISYDNGTPREGLASSGERAYQGKLEDNSHLPTLENIV